MLYFIEMTG